MSWLLKKWQNFIVLAPLASLAFASLSGALFSESVVWALGLLGLALMLSRPDWKWRMLVVCLVVCVAWRTEVIESRVAESHGQSGSEFVEGTLTLGRVDAVFESQRSGRLEMNSGEVRKVMVMRASEYRAGEILEVGGKMFSPGTKESRTNRVEMPKGIDKMSFDVFLRYIYGGLLPKVFDVEHQLKLAKMYYVPALITYCLPMLKEHLSKILSLIFVEITINHHVHQH